MLDNRRGISLIEVILSIGLISIVLIFVMQLFTTIRNNYVTSKSKIEYEVLKSSVIKAVEEDMSLYEISSIYDDCNNNIKIIYNGYRDGDYNKTQKIMKILRTYTSENKRYISYEFDSSITDLTSVEKSSSFVREIPGADSLSINCTQAQNYIKIQIPIHDEYGNTYDIQIFGKGASVSFYSKAC